jgi:hypothetical protein
MRPALFTGHHWPVRGSRSLTLARSDVHIALKRDDQVPKLVTVDVPNSRVLQTIARQDSLSGDLSHVSVHPDGKRLSFTRGESQREIWMIEKLPRPSTGWDRLFRHWIDP